MHGCRTRCNEKEALAPQLSASPSLLARIPTAERMLVLHRLFDILGARLADAIKILVPAFTGRYLFAHLRVSAKFVILQRLTVGKIFGQLAALRLAGVAFLFLTFLATFVRRRRVL